MRNVAALSVLVLLAAPVLADDKADAELKMLRTSVKRQAAQLKEQTARIAELEARVAELTKLVAREKAAAAEAQSKRDAAEKTAVKAKSDELPVAKPTAVTASSLGVSKDQITSAFDPPFAIEPSTPVRGSPRSMGSRELLSLEVIGDPSAVRSVTLMVGVAKNRVDTAAAGMLAMLHLLNATMPEWEGRKQWIVDGISKLANDENAKLTHRAGGKVVQLYRIAALGVFMLTVKTEGDE